MLKRLPLFLLCSLLTAPVFAAKLLVFGDSLSAGYGLTASPGWVSLMQQAWQQQGKPYQVVNASVSGETTVGALQRLPHTLQQHKPDVVLIELGGNDGLRGFSLNTLQHNLNRLIELAKASGAEVILAEIQIPPNYGPRYTQSFTQLFTTVAQQQEIALMPFFLNEIALQQQLMQQDGIHPNDQAQPKITQLVKSYLEPILSKQ